VKVDAPRPDKHLLRSMDDAAREFYDRLAAGSPATTRCAGCGITSFPPRLHCMECGGPTEWVDLELRGVLEAFTTQETAVRFRAPEVLALARVGEVVLPGIAVAPYEELAIGDEVELEPFAEAETGLTLIRFRPAG
jgi:uncharacterized OB-fold protein